MIKLFVNFGIITFICLFAYLLIWAFKNRRFKHSERSATGYTLIEILVALTIAGIIFTGGYVSFRDFSRRQLLAGSLRSLKSDLRLAQEYALIGRKTASANCDGDDMLNGYRFFVSSGSQYIIRAWCAAPGAQVNVKTVDLPADITISTPSPNPILFKVLGEGTNIGIGATATITLTQTSTTKSDSVIVTDGGEIK